MRAWIGAIVLDKWRWPGIATDLLVITVLPWLMLLLVRDWLFPLADMDASFHLGYMLNFDSDLSSFHTMNFQQSRLPWIFPGYLAFRCLPPAVAAYVLHLGFYYAAMVSLYLTLKFTINERCALLATVLLGTYPWFLDAMSSMYWHGAGITYMLLTFLTLTCAAKFRHWQAPLLLAGMSFAALVWLNPVFLVSTPVFVLYYLVMNRENRKNALVVSLWIFAAGSVMLSLVLGMVNLLYGYPFFSVLYALQFAAGFQLSEYHVSRALAQILKTRYLIMPGLCLLSGVLFLVVNRAKRSTSAERAALFFQLLNVVLVSLVCVAALKALSVLTYSEYAAVFIPTMFLALGAQMNRTLELKPETFKWMVCGGVILLISIYPLRTFFAGSRLMSDKGMMLITGPSLMIGLVFFMRHPTSLKGWSLFLLSMLLLFSVSTPVIQGRRSRSGFLAIVKGAKIIRQASTFFAFANQPEPLFWINRTDGVSYALANVFLSAERRMVNPFPVEDWQSDRFTGNSPLVFTLRPAPGDIIVVVSDDAQALDKAEYSLSKLGLTAQLLEEQVIEQGALRYYVMFIEVAQA